MPTFLRHGSQHYQIEFKFRGVRYRKSSGTDSKRLADAMERKWRAEVHEGRVIPRLVEMTVKEAAARYLASVSLPKSDPRTTKRDVWAMAPLVAALGANTPLAELTAPTLSRLRDDLLADQKAPATVNRYLAMVKAMLRKAYTEWGALPSVPAIKLLPLNNWRYRWLTAEEEGTLLSECVPHLHDLVVFLTDTGARLTEATSLAWGNVDLKRQPRGVVRFMVTKSGKPRSVPLTKRAQSLLEHLHSIRPTALASVFLYRPQGRGGRGRAEGFSMSATPFRNPHGAWSTACARAGLTDLHLHDLRHTYASRLVMKGVPLITVSKLLGHASIHMTMRYAHLAVDAMDSAVGCLDEQSQSV